MVNADATPVVRKRAKTHLRIDSLGVVCNRLHASSTKTARMRVAHKEEPKHLDRFAVIRRHHWPPPLRRTPTMKRIGYSTLMCSALLTLALAGAAFATPAPNGAFVNLRTFNDCPLST